MGNWRHLADFARQAAEIDPRIAEQSRALMDVIAGKLVVNNIAYKKGAGRNEKYLSQRE